MDEKEKELIYEWACRYNSKEVENVIFPLIDRSAKSYFVKREKQEEYLHEYDFQTLPELRTLLETMWQDEDDMDAVIKPVLVAAMKNKIEVCQDIDREHMSEHLKDTEKLQPYIYNF